MNTSDKTQKVKRAYRKPTVRVVKLAAREVLATGCKLDAFPSPGPAPVNDPCNLGTCAVSGS